jgi:hypothetical protein
VCCLGSGASASHSRSRSVVRHSALPSTTTGGHSSRWHAASPTIRRFGSIAGDLLFVAIPFYVLAVLTVATRIRLLAAAVGGAAIALLTVWEYRWANTTDSSTAGLAFVGAIQFGIPLAVAAWGFDRLAARLTGHRSRPAKGRP